MPSGIGGGILFEQPGPVFIEFDFDGKTAARVDDFGRNDIGFRQNRFALDGDEHGVGAKHGNILTRAGGVGTHLDMHAYSAEFLFRFADLAATSQQVIKVGTLTIA